jgi:hypothetical protein
MEERDRSLLARAFRNVLGRSALRHREGSLLAEALRRVSETLNYHVNSLESSETPPAVSESDADSGDWAEDSPSPPEKRIS